MKMDDEEDVKAEKVMKIYSGRVATKYDSTMPPFFNRWKREAIERSSMMKGDAVLVFCCGTGKDFPHILKKIGEAGRIVGVDFSSEMLGQADMRVQENGWKNVELVKADVTELKDGALGTFDAVVCTLGLSIIPDHLSAFNNLISHIKKGGEVVIGDMQLATGILSAFNPMTILMAKKYGGTREGHKNGLEIRNMMKERLSNVREKEHFFGSYFYSIGRFEGEK